MRFYVASGLTNRERVTEVIASLNAKGHSVTYDWTKHGDIRREGHIRLSEVASNEVFGVCSAELVLILLPGGKGTHTEFGLSLATSQNKKIIIWSESGREFSSWEETCAFYHHPSVIMLSCAYSDLIIEIEKIIS